ncbi:hypothetical protein [Streptomyces sp. NPDC004134]|uniref:hypothetical protein n=1 Tax=Streptomyces sp. NPDC004134 TaxID=3364691 RepID=UPI0036768A96
MTSKRRWWALGGLVMAVIVVRTVMGLGGALVMPHAVAERLGAPRLAESAHSAYVHGMGLALLVCGITALVTAVVTAVRLPDGGREEDRGSGSPRKEGRAGRGAGIAAAKGGTGQ